MAANRPRFISPAYKINLHRKNHVVFQPEHGEDNPTFFEDDENNDLEQLKQLKMILIILCYI
jgi:hypothetical protein